MLRFKISEDKKTVKLVHFDLNSERSHLVSYFKKKSKKADFNVLVERGIWDGMDSFFKDNEIKIGLWKEIYNFADQYGYETEIEGIEKHLNLSFTKEKYDKYVTDLLDGVTDEFGEPLIPRNYQAESAYRAIKYKFCTQELATAAGKTLIFYIFNSFLRDAGKINKKSKALLIVPKAGLVNQTALAFNRFTKKGRDPLKLCLIGGKNKFDQKIFDESEMIIATYQSLNHWPEERFKSIYCVDVDECLHPSTLITMSDYTTKSISNINIGDSIITKNDMTGELEVSEVDKIHHNLSSEENMFDLELEDGTNILLTGNHRIKLVSGEYIRVDELTGEEDIMSL